MIKTEDLSFIVERKEEGYEDVEVIIKNCPIEFYDYEKYYDFNSIISKLKYLIFRDKEVVSFCFNAMDIAKARVIILLEYEGKEDINENPISIRLLDKNYHIFISKPSIPIFIEDLYFNYSDYFVPTFFLNDVSYKGDNYALDIEKEKIAKKLCRIIFNKDNIEYFWYGEKKDLESMKVNKGDKNE